MAALVGREEADHQVAAVMVKLEGGGKHSIYERFSDGTFLELHPSFTHPDAVWQMISYPARKHLMDACNRGEGHLGDSPVLAQDLGV